MPGTLLWADNIPVPARHVIQLAVARLLGKRHVGNHDVVLAIVGVRQTIAAVDVVVAVASQNHVHLAMLAVFVSSAP